MSALPKIAQTADAVETLIAHWDSVDLAAQSVPTDLTKIQAKQAARETKVNNGSQASLSEERNVFERRHAIWHEAAPGKFGNLPASTAEEFAEHPGCAIRHFKPSGKSKGDIFYIHGGGWVFGSPDTHHRFCQVMCEGTSMNVYSLNYPRAPENSLDTILQAIELAINGIKTEPGLPRILAGDSAGATLSLLTALKSEHSRSWHGLVWLYGPLDPHLSLRSHRTLANHGGLSKDKMAWYWSQLLGKNASPISIDPGDLSKLPACFLACGGQDLLLDDTLHLSRLLIDNSIAVTLQVQAGMPHGYLQMTDHVRAAHQSAEVLFEWIDRLGQEMTSN